MGNELDVLKLRKGNLGFFNLRNGSGFESTISTLENKNAQVSQLGFPTIY